MSLLRDVLTGMFRSVRAFSGAAQVVSLTDGFWRKLSYRAYREFNIAAGSSVWLRLTSTRNFVLQYQSLYVESGSIRAMVVTSPTVANPVWVSVPTVFGRQLLDGTSSHTTALDFMQSGTITGGVEREVLLASAGGGPSDTRNPTGTSLGGWRALPAGVYYIRLEAAAADGVAKGIYSVEAEELV